MTRIKVGIVGCGWVSDWHVRDGIRENAEEFELLACCDTDINKTNEFAARHGVPRATTDYRAMYAMADVEAVIICTPPDSHYNLVIDALAAGKFVICEKPLTSSLALVDALQLAEHASLGKVMPIFQYRFGNGIAKIKQLIQSGILGRAYVSTIETAKSRDQEYYKTPWRGKFATELGGVLLTQAIHIHDLFQWLMGPISLVSASKATRVNPIEVEDCAVANLVMADGSLAAITATLGSVGELVRIRLCFEKATLELSAKDSDTKHPGDCDWLIAARSEEMRRIIDSKMKEVPMNAAGFARQYQLFHEAYVSQSQMPVTLKDARCSLELITAMFHSAETGTAVRLPLSSDHLRYRGWLPDAVRHAPRPIKAMS